MAIPYIRDLEFEYGRCDQLSPLVQRVIADNPGPFTYTGTGVFIIGDKNVCVIDPGPTTLKHEDALNKALEGRTVTHVLVTHHHIDHSPMAKPLARLHNCQVYGFGLQPKPPQGGEIRLEAGDDLSFKPDVEIRDGEVIKGDGWTIEALHTPGHTSNHLCYALHEENTLFSGDHIMGWSTSVVSPPDGDMGDYLRSLETVYHKHFDILRPTHGAAITDVDIFVKAYIEHRLTREAQIEEALGRGLTNILDIVKDLYADIDKRLHPAAAHSVLSHLIHMRKDGRVKATGSDGLKQNYYLA
ncbi:glyoxylase-like metal-dependent hydrolase (beta-lactamase superfamily II) [Litorimonas taeanensis]|uniref:Glyoxylase-like metal-dependent hydrolase (Beta-lactamase superfamily II) n=1 Tax=Litorimonas taeanensis TaxID=568099 RepID=A0A420WIN2_9PROT|nr:MBL fold metallo-hydrolase [Litorimonas taeanensis]RKQ70870.1 glyoxylase-like metal-dependent hydrolase (beta-lactamase superfamily II) [Litorimonas taeanensis]